MVYHHTVYEFVFEGNSLKRWKSRYSSEDMTQELQSQIDICTKDLFGKNKGKGSQAADPIFIVGLPCAGSTLLEQILA